MLKVISFINRYIDLFFFSSLLLCLLLIQINIDPIWPFIWILVFLCGFKVFTEFEIIKPYKIIIILLSLFILSQVISSLLSDSPRISLFVIRRTYILFVVFFSTFLLMKNLEQFRFILISLLTFTAIISTYELVLYFENLPYTDLPIEFYRIDFFGHPNAISAIKTMVILIIIPILLTKEKFLKNKFIYIILTVPIFAAIYFCNSRGNYIAISVALIFIGWIKSKRFMVGYIVFVFLLLQFGDSAFVKRPKSIADINHPNNISRLIMWETGFRIAKDNLIFGIGNIDARDIYRKYKKLEYNNEGINFHSISINMLVKLGVSGLLIWTILMIYIFMKQIQIYKKTKPNIHLNNLALTSLSSMIAFQVNGITEWSLGLLEYMVIVFFNIGLCFFAYKMFIQEKNHPSSPLTGIE